jgi:hypothetical protein
MIEISSKDKLYDRGVLCKDITNYDRGVLFKDITSCMIEVSSLKT